MTWPPQRSNRPQPRNTDLTIPTWLRDEAEQLIRCIDKPDQRKPIYQEEQ